MAITDPNSIAFCNTQVRPISDKFAQLYTLTKLTTQDWTANNRGQLIGVASGNVQDSAITGDGRIIITGNAVQGTINRMNEFVNWLETGNIAGTGSKTYSFLNNFMNVAVNTTP